MILRGERRYLSERGRERSNRAHPLVRSCVKVGTARRVRTTCARHFSETAAETADAQSVADGMGGFLADQLSRYKHPESFEIVGVGPRDDSGKVRRTLLRDERAAPG